MVASQHPGMCYFVKNILEGNYKPALRIFQNNVEEICAGLKERFESGDLSDYALSISMFTAKRDSLFVFSIMKQQTDKALTDFEDNLELVGESLQKYFARIGLCMISYKDTRGQELAESHPGIRDIIYAMGDNARNNLEVLLN